MSDEKKPDPVDDLKKGLGLLFRAAKTAVDELPTGKLEEVVKSGAREVGRAIENVTGAIDEQIFHTKARAKSAPPPEAPPPAAPIAPTAPTANEQPKGDGAPPNVASVEPSKDK